MSTGEQDPLLLMIRGELASTEQMELLESLGRTMLDSVPGASLRQCGYRREDTGASIRFTSWEPEYEDEGPNLSVALYREGDPDSSFMLTFMADRKPFIETPDDEQAEEALAIADELLEFETEQLDSRTRFVIGHMKSMVEFLSGKVEPGDVGDELRKSKRDDTSMAEMLSWDLLSERSGGRVRVKEYGFRWDDGRQLEMSSHELINDVPGYDVHDSDIPKLQIILDVQDFTYCYNLGQDGKRALEVIGMSVEYALRETDEETTDLDEQIAKFRRQIDLDDDLPCKEDVGLLISTLTSASMDDQDFYQSPQG